MVQHLSPELPNNPVSKEGEGGLLILLVEHFSDPLGYKAVASW